MLTGVISGIGGALMMLTGSVMAFLMYIIIRRVRTSRSTTKTPKGLDKEDPKEDPVYANEEIELSSNPGYLSMDAK